MRFRLSHHFDCAPEELWSITDDEVFEQRLGEASGSKRDKVADSMDGGVRVVRRRITLQRDLPGAMRKVIGTDNISYDQITRRRMGENELTWEIEPMVLQGRFVGRGTTRVVAAGAGCERIIEGELSIRVPIVGSKMEKRLVDDVSASYERAAEIVRDMLRERASG